MKKLLLASALIASAATASAGSLEPVGDRIGVHKYNGCEVIVYAEPRTALFGLISTSWDYTRDGRACRDALFPEPSGGDNDNDQPSRSEPSEGPVND